MEISVKESRKGSCTYRMDSARTTGRGRRENRRREIPPKAGAMKAEVLWIEVPVIENIAICIDAARNSNILSNL
jgi:hypothetical protein